MCTGDHQSKARAVGYFHSHLHVFGCSKQTQCYAKTRLIPYKQSPVTLIGTGAEGEGLSLC